MPCGWLTGLFPVLLYHLFFLFLIMSHVAKHHKIAAQLKEYKSSAVLKLLCCYLRGLHHLSECLPGKWPCLEIHIIKELSEICDDNGTVTLCRSLPCMETALHLDEDCDEFRKKCARLQCKHCFIKHLSVSSGNLLWLYLSLELSDLKV